ncbi:MAG TPA: alpha/beta hydrolase [Pseudonocardia sp.]|jgi:pimeloyl-ACP methyl ester carboxylesterase|nr:alpha/beta hydrolase [Pseudonocardia sp.]
MPYLRVEGAELFHTSTGTGPPLVLVHGWTCDSVDWTWLVPPLGEHFRVIAYDRRGDGRSTGESGPHLQRHLADLAAVIEELAGGPAVVVGHSLGATIVSLLAVQRPDLVRGLVSLDAPHAADPAMRPGHEQLRKALDTDASHAVLQGFFAEYGFTDQTPDWVRVLIQRRVDACSAATIMDGFLALWDDDLQIAYRPAAHDYLARRTCPVLVLHSKADSAAYEEAAFRHPASRAVVLAGAGHWPQLERPAEVSSEIVSWWRDAAAALSGA